MTNIVYDFILPYLPYDRKSTPSGWVSFNGPCCIHNGERRPDTRKRAGLMLTPDNHCRYNCFNCKYSFVWVPGQGLSTKAKSFMLWIGIPDTEIRKINFKVWQLRESNFVEHAIVKEYHGLKFGSRELPNKAQPLEYWLSNGCDDPNFLQTLNYLVSRGTDILTGYNYYWSPIKEDNMNKRIILPFTWKGEIVGWTARASFETRFRYISDIQPNYIFNADNIERKWKYIFINEGPFDAISNCGIGMLGDKISDEQIMWIKQTGKTPIVVPDREKKGGKLVDAALKEGWAVSFPLWEDDIKDSAMASERYGQLYTVKSLLDSATTNKLRISVERQKYK